MRVRNNALYLSPLIPEQWKGYSFKVWFRDNLLKVTVSHSQVNIENQDGPAISLSVYEKMVTVSANSTQAVDISA